MTTDPNRSRSVPWIAVGLLAVLVGVIGAGFRTLPPPEREIVAYATGLTGRTPAQRHNAELAAHALDGAVIAPGATLSFNHAVKSWSLDQGYVKAPVSYDGELVPAYGGGVCQTSTTLYNAGLLAGLVVVERHHHVFAPHYVPPGRDAAVAYPSIDLRLRNAYAVPLRVRATTRGGLLEVSLWGNLPLRPEIGVVSEVLSTTFPQRVVRSLDVHAGAFHRNAGSVGYHVVTYRVIRSAGTEPSRRERLSDDTYPAMDHVVTVAALR